MVSIRSDSRLLVVLPITTGATPTTYLMVSVSTGVGTLPFGACSDELNFWIGLGTGRIARF